MNNNLIKYIRAKRPIIWCNTNDYKEIDDLLQESIENIENKEIYEFRALGAVDFRSKEIYEEGKNLYQFIDSIFSEGLDTNVFLLIKNAKLQLETPEVIAYLAKIAELRYSKPNFNFTILIIGKSIDIPKELEEFVTLLDFEIMNDEEIKKYIIKFSEENSIPIIEEELGEMSKFLKGLSKLKILNILNMMTLESGIISIRNKEIILKEKEEFIKKTNILELVKSEERIEDVGGLEGLKEWLQEKAKVFKNLDKIKDYGVDIPKGVLLLGMPGCGKSLIAKATSNLFDIPLLKLDVGRLLGKYVGESEHNMRIALETAETVSPCILWIDEIEKAFSGIDQRGGASDITKRLFGQFLTWLQEKKTPIFVIATANDISSFPPEFLRKGRFDEIFFIDFPNEEERENILKIHLKKRGKNIDFLKSESTFMPSDILDTYMDIRMKNIIKKMNLFSGSDIEEIVKILVEKLFIYNKDKIRTEDILDIIDEFTPLSEVLNDKIENMRKGFEKFKIKSASKILGLKIKHRNIKTLIEGLIFVQGGKYQYKREKLNFMIQIPNLEVSKYMINKDTWNKITLISENYNKENLFFNNFNPLNYKNISTMAEIIFFCNNLSKIYNLQPVYIIGNDNKIFVRQLDGKIVDLNKANFNLTEGFRLPTELEWDWFANGGRIALDKGIFYSLYKEKYNDDKFFEISQNQNNNLLNIEGCIMTELELCHEAFSKEEKQLREVFQKINSSLLSINDSDSKIILKGGNEKVPRYHQEISLSNMSNIKWNKCFRVVRTVK